MKPITIHAGALHVTLLPLGAIVRDVRLDGVDYNLTRGPKDWTGYQNDWPYHGVLIGPIVNRISTARVKIGGMMHELERNQDGRIHLHSGKDGTQHQEWSVTAQSSDAVTFEITLPDGMCGLPGHRVITATYRVTAPATLSLDITGVSDSETMMNFANHSYWNLDGTADWSGHQLSIDADRYLPITADAAPTGEIADVSDTVMDLRAGRTITAKTDVFDHNFCLSETRQPLRDVLRLKGQSGLTMTMATTETGLQVYDGRDTPAPYEALAFEAQSWPDAPTHRGFPSIRLKTGDTYRQSTQWRFER